MKKVFQILAVFLAGFAVAAACSDGANDAQHDPASHHRMQNMTKVVKNDGLQAAFDLMTAESHMQMAEMMKSERSQTPGTDHHLSITLMDPSTKKVISDAQNVQISVTGPGGETVSGAGHIMSGGGMHHHGFDFAMRGRGSYRAKVTYVYNGKDYVHEALFEM